jgi:transcription elongation factor
LDQNGQIRLVQPHQISMRRDSNRAIATDSEGHELRVNDNVKEIEGEVSKSKGGRCQILADNLARAEKDEFFISIKHSSPSCTIGISQKTAASS